MTAPLRFVFGLHLHQPVGNFDHVMADHVRDVYRPIIERSTAAGLLPLTLHVSGPLLEWLEQHDTAWLRSEERRVGKECRSRWAADALKKKEEKGGYSVSGNQARQTV